MPLFALEQIVLLSFAVRESAACYAYVCVCVRARSRVCACVLADEARACAGEERFTRRRENKKE